MYIHSLSSNWRFLIPVHTLMRQKIELTCFLELAFYSHLSDLWEDLQVEIPRVVLIGDFTIEVCFEQIRPVDIPQVLSKDLRPTFHQYTFFFIYAVMSEKSRFSPNKKLRISATCGLNLSPLSHWGCELIKPCFCLVSTLLDLLLFFFDYLIQEIIIITRIDLLWFLLFPRLTRLLVDQVDLLLLLTVSPCLQLLFQLLLHNDARLYK